MKLDLIDRRILSELSEDARQDQTALARKLKLGRDRIKYRIQKLRRAGVIKDLVTLVNPTTLGISLYKTYFRLNSDRRKIPKLLAYLDKHPRTFWVAECAGQWDLVHVTFARSPKEFSLIQDRLLSLFNDCIIDTSIYTLTDAWYFGRGYLSGMGFERVYVGGMGPEVSIDGLDLKLLRLLAANAGLPYVQLGKAARCSPATARNRVERLEKQGVVAFYRLELNLESIGRWYYKAQLYFSQHDPRREDELRGFCRAEPDIVYLVKQIGACRLEIELEVESFETYNQIIDRLRDRFVGYVQRIDTILIRKQRIRGAPMDVTPVVGAQ